MLCFVVPAYDTSICIQPLVQCHRQTKPSSSARCIASTCMCHRPARRRRRQYWVTEATATAAVGTSCFVGPMPPLYTYVFICTVLNNPPSSSRTLNLEIVARRRLIFFSVAAPQIRKLTQTRALHTRAAIIRVTQLNSTKPNQELYSRYQPLLQQIHPPSYNG